MHQPTEEFSVHATTSTSTCPTFNSAGWTFVANHRSQAASLHLSLNRPELDLAPRPPRADIINWSARLPLYFLPMPEFRFLARNSFSLISSR